MGNILKSTFDTIPFLEEHPTVKRCGQQRCRLSPYLLEGNRFSFKGKYFHIKTSMSCMVKTSSTL